MGPWLNRHSGPRPYPSVNSNTHQSPQNRMSVTPNTNSKYSGVEKPTHLTHAKKSLISRACSSPSIVSLYQEPFIGPSDTLADNILGTQNPPGNNSEISNKPVIN